jgi:hypothetical protein
MPRPFFAVGLNASMISHWRSTEALMLSTSFLIASSLGTSMFLSICLIPRMSSFSSLTLSLVMAGFPPHRRVSLSAAQYCGNRQFLACFALSFGQRTIKHFRASNRLRIVGIFDLDPGRRVRASLGLADDSFQVLLARQLKESLPVAFQVLHVQQMGIVRWNQPVEPPLAIQKRPGAKINAIQPEEIERVVTWFERPFSSSTTISPSKITRWPLRLRSTCLRSGSN